MGRLGGAEWLIIILLVVLLFGAKRLPDAARGVGRSLRIFKAETKGLIEDGKEPVSEVAATPQPASQSPTQAPTQSATAATAGQLHAEASQRTETPPQA